LKTFLFSHARTALKYGLKSLNIKKGDEILIPSYICDVITHPLNDMGLSYQFYEIDKSFQPLWYELQNLVNPMTKAIIMVNYFGNTQNINKFQTFANHNNIFLIEDNSHGYGGKFNNKLLGTFGDIGISSPRKLLNLRSGGVLYLNKPNLTIDISNLKYFKDDYFADFFNKFLKKRINTHGELKNLFKHLFFKRPKYESQFAFKEKKINDYLIGEKSKLTLENANLELIKNSRRTKYFKWEHFCIKNKLEPVFKKLDDDVIPWCFPTYVENNKQAIYWFEFGWKNDVTIFSWPTLPDELNSSKGINYKRWEKLVCFSTENYLL